jgi:hypothetical protein
VDRLVSQKGAEMAIYGKKFNAQQRECLNRYEGITGIEPLLQDDFDAGEISFEELWRVNVMHLEDILASIANINIPWECDEKGNEVIHFADRTVTDAG